ncbi:putative methyltransferase PMT26 [Dichanthelium oligosanthes]|uniref:Putative methyltransferase PMT26 n=1 Tax=Dichanthelium oligosanthes TaxID=888268 RepID=A0A1E5VS30_9POAL|nr:putative methyltransferase PMT26 [Dichanthelium oligosanthes]
MPLFERDRYQRLDGGWGAGAGASRRPPSSFCSSATVVVFVALCLVAAWMMASSNNIAVTVSPESKSEAKDQAGSVDFAQTDGGGDADAVSDTPQTSDEAGGAGRKDDVAGGTSQTRDVAGDGDTAKDDAGDTGKNDDGAGAAQTTDDPANNDVSQSDVAVTTDATANGTTGGTDTEESGKPDGTTVAEGETPSKNQTFSDENGKSEGGEVAKPEDPDKNVEQSAEQATIEGEAKNTTSSQAEKNTDQNTDETDGQAEKNNAEESSPDAKDSGNQADENAKEVATDGKDTGSQADKSAEKASTDDKNTGGQADNTGGQDSDSTKETTTEEKETSGSDGGTTKNETTFDDVNGKMDGVQPVKEDGNATEKNSDEAASSDKAENTDDDTSTSAASKNATSEGQNVAAETMAFAGADGTNGTITPDTENFAMNSSATTEEKKPAAGDGDAAEKAELLPSGQAELLNETASVVAENGAFPTQAAESSEEKKAHTSKNKKKKKTKSKDMGASGETTAAEASYTWKFCNVTTGADYIPCLDNEAAIKKLKTNKHYEHRERHCPADAPTCLVPLPEGYRQSIPWPYSRDKIWYHNVPHTKLASYKGHQNWVKVSGEHLTFPGGGTQFKYGALHYIELIEEALPEVAWGRRSRVVLDVGCGVASFGGFMFDKDALTISFAPKDEHEAQVQFALERGIPAVSAVMGTKRLPFPGNVYDVIHCARCRVPWHIEGGTLLLEVNRLLRPGGLFVWSATPVYRKVPEDVKIWHAMAALTKSMCWEIIKKTSDTVDQTAMVIFKKPTSNDCYDARAHAEPPLCEASDDQNAAWNITLQACMHRVPTDASARGSQWPSQWPDRLSTTPYWLSADQVGVYGKPAPADFAADQEHWRKVVENSYLDGMGIDWKNVRNVMDMRAVYGGFAAALRGMKVWVMNVVTIDSPDTLPIIYERGLFGMYHDWCESFSTYPRSYDLVHADHLFSKLKSRCKLLPVIVEVDRILRPEGKLIVRDDTATMKEVQSIARSLHWEVRMTVSKQGEGLLCVGKTTWRPTEVEALS